VDEALATFYGKLQNQSYFQQKISIDLMEKLKEGT